MFNNMVISGGSLRAICAIGLIKYLEEQNIMNNIKTYVGTSAGSIVCLLATLGMTSIEMIDFIKKTVKKDYVKKLDETEVLNFLNTYGLNSGILIERFIEDAILYKLGFGDISFLELTKQTGRNLVVCVANISKECEEYWSVDTTPSMSVIKAIRASCSLPFIFTPVKYNDCLYVDGGLLNKFPIDYFQETNMKNIVGFCIKSVCISNIENMLDYVNALMATVMNVICQKNTPKIHSDNIVHLEMNDLGLFSLEDCTLKITDEMIDKFVETGYNSTIVTFSKFN